VFDTNVYRALGDTDLANIMADERKRSVIANPCYQVVQELVAHLADQADPEFSACHSGLDRLGRHCRTFDGSRFQLRFPADALDQVAMSVFGQGLSESVIPDEYAAIVGNVVDGAVAADWETHRSIFGEIAKDVRLSRAAFASEMRAIVGRLASSFGFPEGDLSAVLADQARRKVLSNAFDSDDLLDGPAQMLYRQIARTLRVSFDEFPPAAISQIRTTFPTPLRFMNQILKKAIFDGLNLEKRASLGHDLRISFLASGSAKVDGCPVCLVTDDGLIHDAAAGAGTSAYVVRLDDYRRTLATNAPLPGT
jgi:hypothetical protein